MLGLSAQLEGVVPWLDQRFRPLGQTQQNACEDGRPETCASMFITAGFESGPSRRMEKSYSRTAYNSGNEQTAATPSDSAACPSALRKENARTQRCELCASGYTEFRNAEPTRGVRGQERRGPLGRKEDCTDYIFLCSVSLMLWHLGP